MTTPNTTNKCVYPSEAQITRWLEEHYGSQEYGKPMKSDIGIVRAACDWQREQDALICEAQKTPEAERVDHFYNVGIATCASAIRPPIPQEGGKHE